MKNKSIHQLALKKRKISTLNSYSIAGGTLTPTITITVIPTTTTSSSDERMAR